MTQLARSSSASWKRRRGGAIVAWILFVRFPLLFGALFVAFPFLATGPASPLLGNLFLLGLGGLSGVTLLALLVGKTLVLATGTASCSGPIRLLPARAESAAPSGSGSFVEPREGGLALAWDPDGPLAKSLSRWAEVVALGLALPTIVVAFTASCEPRAGWDGKWTLYKMIAVSLAAMVYLFLRAAASVLERWFENPEDETEPASRGPLARLERRALRKSPPAFAGIVRRLAVHLLLLRSFRVGYLRERSSDEAWREYVRRREEGESEEALRATDDLTLRYDLLPGHAAAFSFFGLIFLGYLLLGAANYPGWFEPWFPTLGYVLVLIMGVSWGLAALSFWLDRYRVPVLTIVVLTSVATAQIGGGDHFFRLIEPQKVSSGLEAENVPPPGLPPSTLSPDEQVLVGHILERCELPIVAVAAAGGGITSSAWTAAMLTRLAEGRSGGDFLDALRVVSGVSGGSVGAMFFLDAVSERAKKGERLSSGAGVSIRGAAWAPGLDSVGWGLAYPDLARAFFSPLLSAAAPMLDRSWALERSWEVQLARAAGKRGVVEGSVPTLRGWREATLAGRLPAVILNATTVESGERFQMSTLRLTNGSGRSDFWEAYPGYDLALPTAARLSATFPFVSTAARAHDCCGGVRPGAHFVDGGYYDNSGLLSALELLDRILGDLAERDLCKPPVVIVRLEAFEEQALTIANVEPSSGWKSSIVSPIQTLVEVRTSTQVYRNTWEVGMFAGKWRERGFKVEAIRLPLGGLGPLSWKLTAGEIARIDRVAEDLMRSSAALSLIGLLEGQSAVFPAAAPVAADAAARSEFGPKSAN